MIPKNYHVYMMANESGSLYIGVSGALEGRVWRHQNGIFENSFTKKYKCNKLVYFEVTSDVRAVLQREKQLKGWTRFKKTRLIQKMNPTWRDLSDGFHDPDPSNTSDSSQDDMKSG